MITLESLLSCPSRAALERTWKKKLNNCNSLLQNYSSDVSFRQPYLYEVSVCRRIEVTLLLTGFTGLSCWPKFCMLQFFVHFKAELCLNNCFCWNFQLLFAYTFMLFINVLSEHFANSGVCSETKWNNCWYR